jgi:hypothetical protein
MLTINDLGLILKKSVQRYEKLQQIFNKVDVVIANLESVCC